MSKAKAPTQDRSIVGRMIRSLELAKPAEILGNPKTFKHTNADMIFLEDGIIHTTSKKTGEEAVFSPGMWGVAKLLPKIPESLK